MNALTDSSATGQLPSTVSQDEEVLYRACWEQGYVPPLDVVPEDTSMDEVDSGMFGV